MFAVAVEEPRPNDHLAFFLFERAQNPGDVARIVLPVAIDADHVVVAELDAVATRNDAGEITGALVLFHDITELKKIDQVRRDFVANVSHELRTPLSILRGYIETLLDSPEMPREDDERVRLVSGLLRLDEAVLVALNEHLVQGCGLVVLPEVEAALRLGCLLPVMLQSCVSAFQS